VSERIAIVVGAGGELGRATAKALAGAGYTVVGVDRNEQGLKELPDGIRREVGDATVPVTAKSLIDRIAAEVGPPEVLVNTIGMFRLGEAVAATPPSAARSSRPTAPSPQLALSSSSPRRRG
jgi:NAD(P)-dependent dehydrogenase (short-subunit alcohol dehydrogenase family)